MFVISGFILRCDTGCMPLCLIFPDLGLLFYNTLSHLISAKIDITEFGIILSSN